MKTLAAVLCVFAIICFNGRYSLGQRRSFTVQDDISLVHFGDLYSSASRPVLVSPDGKLVVVQTEYGSLEDDRLHDVLRVYDMSQLQHYVNASKDSLIPLPLWVLQEATNKDGSESTLISHIRWLKDSTGFAFLLRNESGHMQLCLADIGPRSVANLTPSDRNVTSFEINSRDNYVFTATTDGSRDYSANEAKPAIIIGSGKTLYDTAFPQKRLHSDRSELWAAVDGMAAPIVNPQTGYPIIVYPEGTDNMALSPDGRSLLIALPVPEIPREWETKYPPPYKGFDTPITAGKQDLNSNVGVSFVSEYAEVDLKSGKVELMSEGPTALRAGWWANFAAPAWSSDGKWIVLPGAFVPSQEDSVTKPCVAVSSIAAKDSLQCVLPLKRNLASGFEPGYKRILRVAFRPGSDTQIDLSYLAFEKPDDRLGFMTCRRDTSGMWVIESDGPRAPDTTSLRVEVKMSFEESPKLVATDTTNGHSKVIWDPNPQLKNINFGKASMYRWKDETGRSWSAILYMPANYVAGQSYPLVIQTHGFDEARFSPSGGFPSAFVAQELATSGIAVLQMRDCDGRGTPQELPCNVVGYESAVDQLSKAGLVDSQDVGLIGFSRTVSYVLAALTTSKLHFKAASIYDGINLGYFEQVVDMGADAFQKGIDAMIGGVPYGPGLHEWKERSPEFNMDKVTTPLRIVARGELGSVGMWEPYALLREMHRPVEFVQLNTDEHVITNPAVRLAVQGGNVDWFRFWLQGYKDPDPSKADQYRRWEHLKELQAADDKAAGQSSENTGATK